MGMTRTLNLGFAVLPLLDWIHQAVGLRGKGDGRRAIRHLGHAALLAAGAFLGYAPQLLLHRLVDDRWFIDAYGIGSGRFEGLLDNLWGLFLQRPNSAHLDGLLLAMPLYAWRSWGSCSWSASTGGSDASDRNPRRAAVRSRILRVLLGPLQVRHVVSRPRLGHPLPGDGEPPACRARTLGKARLRALGSAVVLCAARNGWCVFRQVAETWSAAGRSGWETCPSCTRC